MALLLETVVVLWEAVMSEIKKPANSIHKDKLRKAYCHLLREIFHGFTVCLLNYIQYAFKFILRIAILIIVFFVFFMKRLMRHINDNGIQPTLLLRMTLVCG